MEIDEVTEEPGQATSVLSFEQFYATHHHDALKLAILLVRDPGHAADLVQEVFTSAFTRWSNVSGYDRPDLWLRRLVINRAISRRRRVTSELKTMVRLGGRRTGQHMSAGDGEYVGLWSDVGRLPRRQAEALALVYGCDLSVVDAAAVMKCSTGSVKTHLSRGRAALATSLKEQR